MTTPSIMLQCSLLSQCHQPQNAPKPPRDNDPASPTRPFAALRSWHHSPKEPSRTLRPPHSPSASLSVTTNLPPSTSPSSPGPSTGKHLPRSPYISSRQVSSQLSSPVSGPSATLPTIDASGRQSSSRSATSSNLDSVLVSGDIVGEGCLLQNEPITLVSIGEHPTDDEQPAKEFQVISRLGSGSYAVVYEVVEVLSRPPPSDEGHSSTMDPMELEEKRPTWKFGRHYAIKCLSKANLDEDALAAQMSEVKIHQSLRSHPNIVTLYRTLETSAYLLLLLEFVPGEDLFYFLEQARDHYDSDSSTDSASPSSFTPPTPSLLSTMDPSQLLSKSRLMLIASMFSQMCDAVAACHAQQVFHRDIKPENFIVTDGWTTLPDGRRERKVFVKLTDFGLSTTDIESSDMDCGSAPYMSYECRNNIAPTYRPRAADVWSLGIVLINMLYHCNPWTDTNEGACASFSLFRSQPVDFFMQRFIGMTRPVAELFATKVFCLIDDPYDDSPRLTASEFGNRIKDLPMLLGDYKRTHKRVVSTGSSQGHPLSSSVPPSRRASSRNVSRCATPLVWTPAVRSLSLSRVSSAGPSYERETSDLTTVLDREIDDRVIEEEDEKEEDSFIDIGNDNMSSRSASTHRRRKRGARKGKNASVSPQSPAPPEDLQDLTLNTLAMASQTLAREISNTSHSSSKKKPSKSAPGMPRRALPREPVPMFALPNDLLSAPAPLPPPLPLLTKKPSKWKLSFGKSSMDKVLSSPAEESPPSLPGRSLKTQHVSTLVRGLDAPSSPRKNEGDLSSRGRRPGSAKSADSWASSLEPVSPVSSRSAQHLSGSSASSIHSNWRSSRSSMSSATTSTSAFTRYSNASARSVSTAATSVSSSSWRNKPALSSNPDISSLPPPPGNVKIIEGMPWELGEPPRQLHSNPVGNPFSSPPPPRKHRPRKPKDNQLDTINERPGAQKSPLSQDASRSVIDLEEVDGDGQKKVQKGQITALAKMLSALRR